MFVDVTPATGYYHLIKMNWFGLLLEAILMPKVVRTQLLDYLAGAAITAVLLGLMLQFHWDHSLFVAVWFLITPFVTYYHRIRPWRQAHPVAFWLTYVLALVAVIGFIYMSLRVS
ncbi:hypothetical protein FC34_GL000861 [Lacticaseibacillus brantae DSM 23927]|uniref:Uncharacterized protein n=2 Tax=Lacticaseibacillus brantae TaxID=943673 RepID=A0A0R2AX64_9LACO|nr:hypothetical protein FC34_GL000861 [Lacticaseibacillus brantae DSM 23927]